MEVGDCCKGVNRGVAYWDGKIYVGALDGRLIAIKGFQSLLTGSPIPYPRLLPNTNRVIVFKLGAKGAQPAVVYPPRGLPAAPPEIADADRVAEGGHLFNRYCLVCHGLDAKSDRIHPDLRYSNILGNATDWAAVLEDGVRKDLGMVSFRSVISPDQAEAVRAFVIHQSHIAASVPPAQRVDLTTIR